MVCLKIIFALILYLNNKSAMEIKKRIIIFLLFILNIWSFIAAQQLSVDVLPLGGQLPSNSVQRIFQDREGFMWFGTREGLSRYDGYRVLTFRSGKTTPNLLTDNQITSITDSWERVLIGTKKGLNILNKKTYEICHVDNEELKDQEIRSILFDSKGYIWVGTYIALYRCSSDFLRVADIHSFTLHDRKKKSEQ